MTSRPSRWTSCRSTRSGSPYRRRSATYAYASSNLRARPGCCPDKAKRTEITASPNKASTKQLEGLPPALVFVDEADVLRDEGEAYAAKLRAAGVPVTTVHYDGTIHDFMLLNPLSETTAARAAIDQATTFLRSALGTG